MASTQDKLVDTVLQMLFGLLEWMPGVVSAMESDGISLLATCQACFLSRFLFF